ncbi:MAG: carbon monoxide dehydrogenase, partial [Smithella sp.]
MSEFKDLTICKDAQIMLKKAQEDGIETVWDRLKKQQPQCGYCELGVSCRNCAMGPCRIDPFGEGPQLGVCGADADIIVARNLARMVAAGSASHSDHGRDIVDVLHKIGL